MNGAQVASSIPADQLERLLGYGAKLIRVFIAWAGDPAVLDQWTPEQWRIHLIEQHARLIETNLLPVFERYPESRFVLNLLHPCGGFDPDQRARCFGSAVHLQWHIFDAWNIGLRRLWEHPQCLVADLLNEPAGEPKVVNEFYRNCSNYVPTTKRIAVSPIYGKANHLARVEPLARKLQWITVHIYEPMSFSHSGIGGRPPQRWSRQVERELESALEAVKTWQRRTKKIIYVGEFGVSTFAHETDRAKWFEVVLDYCRRNSWHWTAHCFGESENVWDIETAGILPQLKRAWR